MNEIAVAFSTLGRQLFSKSIPAPGLACVWDAHTSQQLVSFRANILRRWVSHFESAAANTALQSGSYN